MTARASVRRFSVLLALMLLLTVVVTPAPAAQASTTITVTTTDDEVNTDGDCSLREAVIAANTNMAVDACPGDPGIYIIAIPAGVYVLSSAYEEDDNDDPAIGDIELLDEVQLHGAQDGVTVIDVEASKVGIVALGSRVALRWLTIRNADTAISVVHKRVGSHSWQTAYAVIDRVRVLDSERGISILGGIVSIHNSAILRNSVGIWAQQSTLHVATSLVANNSNDGQSTAYGSGIIVFSNSDEPNAVLNVRNSTITGNRSAGYGAGIWAEFASVMISNSTVTNNAAGAGMSRTGINDVPRGGGVWRSNRTTLRVVNSILAGNRSHIEGMADDCAGKGNLNQPFGYNILGTGMYCVLIGDEKGTIYTDNPRLAPLASNGGRTQTHALLDGSPAIDAGNPLLSPGPHSCRNIDQRGTSRPRDGDGDGTARCDIGAYER
jgi:CSLREA domain-containing protein